MIQDNSKGGREMLHLFHYLKNFGSYSFWFWFVFKSIAGVDQIFVQVYFFVLI